MNLQFWLMVGTFLAGVLTMGWIKTFQIARLTEERDAAKEDAKQARLERDRTVGAANVVVDAERTIDRAGDLPKLERLGVLLGDAKREAPRSSGGKT